MRRMLLVALLAVAVPLGVVVRADPPAPANVTLETFERNLAADGEWITFAPYGTVWRPLHVGPGWRPYYHGEWIWTDEGWLWTTDEPWGWATYHYGRWVHDPVLGWLWIPGFEWAPAWVAWRMGGGVVGWAPLWPGIVGGWVDPPPIEPGVWIFVPIPRFVGVRVEQVAYPPARAPHLVRATRPAPPPRWSTVPPPPGGGPSHRGVERAVGRPVPPVRIVPVPTPAEARRGARDGTAPAYRPAPAPRPSPGARPTPTRAPRPAPSPDATRR
ncbi:DUF6600 domain-containing protein [Anaeromyxobacter oryzae]|uniref:Uncharacterized protein n=1 Tax=Anaeromyxobacter oryzae TaxID=2918170 RepID=A0ABN6MTC7_9BACT|nr:DUF6600 domain-containing protein [Anaeromyxobacter oryzae]BDG02999.1 hypothetical protein AMOR_19950 [Anaeromyxobacter oryzae]